MFELYDPRTGCVLVSNLPRWIARAAAILTGLHYDLPQGV